MVRRYHYLPQELKSAAEDKLLAAFLVVKNGREVEEILRSILTQDERLRIGRRIEIAFLLQEGITYEAICEELKVGRTTVQQVARKLAHHPQGFESILSKDRRIEKETQAKSTSEVGPSMMVFNKRVRTRFDRKDVKR